MDKLNLISKPLPYTMGNGGDLIKHGILAEFSIWHSKEFIFYDPFGGRPWQYPVNNVVSKRINSLGACSLKKVQLRDPQKYIGSGHIVAQLNKKGRVYSSDRDTDARQDLHTTGIAPIDLENFNSENGYSILDSKLDKEKDSLILIDPFYDLEEINNTVLQKIIKTVETSHTSIALYVLYKQDKIEHWKHFQEINKKLVNNQINFISLECETIENSGIKGESKFNSYLILYLHKDYSSEQVITLSKAIQKYASNLTKVIGVTIEFNSQIT